MKKYNRKTIEQAALAISDAYYKHYNFGETYEEDLTFWETLEEIETILRKRRFIGE